MNDRTLVVTEVKMNNYERILRVLHEESGLEAFIVIHNTHLGPALGGIRCYPYDNEESQLTDTLLLAADMTFKNATSGLDHGGAKTTINSAKIKDRKVAFRILGKIINTLDGGYVCTGDIGVTNDDLICINDVTHYVAGINLDSSLPTALGVYTSIETLVGRVQRYPENCSFMIQGLGKVGMKLAEMLLKNKYEGKVYAFDVKKEPFDYIRQNKIDVIRADATEVYTKKVDVFVPCAVEAVLNKSTLSKLNSSFICGSANNMFGDREDIMTLRNNKRYVPDFISNCGGVVAAALNFQHKDYTTALTVDLRKRITDILNEAYRTNIPAQVVAEDIAHSRLNLKKVA
jgi:glutamate dehydrogenase/leucine dehydrogenase